MFSGTAIDIYLSDSTTTGSSTISVTTGALAKTDIGDGTTALDMSGDDLTSASNAQAALDDINAAIANIATRRGNLGATMNRLQSAVNVINNQTQNLSAAEDGIRAADIAQEVANMTKYSILSQTGISSLAQANQMQQSVLSLLK